MDTEDRGVLEAGPSLGEDTVLPCRCWAAQAGLGGPLIPAVAHEGRQPRYEVLLKEVPAMLVAGIRDTVTHEADIPTRIDELQTTLARLNSRCL